MGIRYWVLGIATWLGAQRTVLGARLPPRLSSEAYISLITCSPGKVLYEAFGHSAFRVYDPVNKIDVTFNYGTFDFDRPGFYSSYAKGRPVFTLSIAPTGNFISAYVMDNRSVAQDILNLTPGENQKLFGLLIENHQPENRDYVYDYIYDNCSTRLRDIIARVLNGKIVFDSTHIKESYSFRDLMDLYARKDHPVGDFAIDLALGSEIDAKAKPYQYMFLPDYLQAGFRNARILDGDSSIPLIKNSNVIFKAGPEEIPKSLLTPVSVFWCVFLIFTAITIFDLRRGKVSIAPDMLFFFIIGLTGCVVAYISFFSDHHAGGNYNLLWAMPTHLIFALLLPFKNLKRVRFYFLLAAALAVAAWSGGLTIFPQQMHFALIPLILTIAMRGVLIYKKRYFQSSR